MAKREKPLRSEQIRDRVVRVDRIMAGGLRSHPHNWRTHGKRQRAAMRDVFKDVGFVKPVDAYIAREGDKLVAAGKLKADDIVIMDGHCRVEELPKDFLVPVNITDLTEKDALYYLATCDPLSGLAGQDDQRLTELLHEVDSAGAAVEKMLADLLDLGDEEDGDEEDETESGGDGKFQIIVTCADEAGQRELLEEFMARGLNVRALVA